MLKRFRALSLLLVGVLGLACSGSSHKDSYTTVDLYKITNFSCDAQTAGSSDVPVEVRALDGKRIRACGVIFAPETEGNPLFLIAKDNFTLSRPPTVEQRVRLGPLPAGFRLTMSREEGCVSGVFHVDVQRDDRRITQLFRLDVEGIELK